MVTRTLILANEVTTADWIIASSVMIGAILVAALLRRTIRSIESQMRFEEDVTTLVGRILGLIIMLVALVYALRQLGVAVGPLLGALGIGGVVIALSLQPVLGNFVGSIMLHARRPIRRGDQIHTNGQSGTVVDINGRAVVMMTFDGELVHLPNLKVLDEALVNQTADEYRRTLIPFQVSYETDLRATQELLTKRIRSLEILGEAPASDVHVTGFGDSGVDMVARLWHPSEELTARWLISEVAITIRETLAEAGITIPYPQRVLHLAPPDDAERSPDQNGADTTD